MRRAVMCFFFRAEDGIRDLYVTGVQTCALPILLVLEDVHWSDAATLDLLSSLARRDEPARLMIIATYRPMEVLVAEHPRSEERRVGKESRSRSRRTPERKKQITLSSSRTHTEAD